MLRVKRRETANDPPACEFIPSHKVHPIKPPWYGDAQPPLDPEDYFITTGEAVMKCRQLIRDIQHEHHLCLQLPPDHPFNLECRKALQDAHKFLDYLIQVRGDNIFLECERLNGVIRCRRTNPKAKPPSLFQQPPQSQPPA